MLYVHLSMTFVSFYWPVIQFFIKSAIKHFQFSYIAPITLTRWPTDVVCINRVLSIYWIFCISNISNFRKKNKINHYLRIWSPKVCYQTSIFIVNTFAIFCSHTVVTNTDSHIPWMLMVNISYTENGIQILEYFVLRTIFVRYSNSYN